MKPGWYIVNYHDVNFEDSILTRALGGTVRPDLFRRHLAYMASKGEFCSLSEGVERLQEGRLDRPYFSIWFDDGFSGLKTYADPICADFGVKPIVSVCMRFALRQEMFWRSKLSVLAHLDGLRLLRSRLRGEFGRVPFKVRKWTLENYDHRVQAAIDEIYDEVTTEEFRSDAFRIFLSEGDLQDLVGRGWDVTNHSVAHTPWSKPLGWSGVRASLDEADAFIEQLGGDPRYWVVPFDFGFEHYRAESEATDKVVVLVGGRPNVGQDSNPRLLWRYAAPETLRFGSFFR
jgi:hypothetical protein